MATKFNITTSNVLMDCFPTFGSSCAKKDSPRWLPSMGIFVTSEYSSDAGHRYMKGIRFSENLVVSFTFSFWNSWTYLNEIELYRFNGSGIELMDRRKFEKQFYDEGFLKQEVHNMVRGILESSLRVNGQVADVNLMDDQITQLVEGTYRPLGEYDRGRLNAYIKSLPSGR